jgi:predicted helicase
VLDRLDEHNLGKEAEGLQKFYDSVKRRAAGVDKAEAKQKIIVELYDKFFRTAFPKMTERLGIVYTPVEVVDFIIHSVNEVLQSEFGQTLGSRGVHILDPFTGTGTFITRLLQSGLIKPEELAQKYRDEIHANEIVLLAYYIAAINIEAAYHGVVGGEYQPFEGICLTDTFQLYEQDRDLIGDLMADNNQRLTRQKKLDIRVILGNPPYSVGQSSENDNAKKIEYPRLDERIRGTYAARSGATLRNALYDSYIRAIRWASDRIGNAGVVAYVSNAGWLDANTADGLRKCMAEEFASIHVFHLRGNARTSGEQRRKEKDNVFGQGTRTPVAITLLVKNPNATAQGQICFHDIGDYLSREEKLAIISRFGSIGGIKRQDGWQTISPDEHGDWLKQRDDGFAKFIALGDKDDTRNAALFADYSGGVKTNRDAWCYNPSKQAVADNMSRMVSAYEDERKRFALTYPPTGRKARENAVEGFINTDPVQISWTRELKTDLVKDKPLAFQLARLTSSLYRPFTQQWLYYDRRLNNTIYQMPRIFPMDGQGQGNRVICTSSGGEKVEFSVLMSKALPSLHLVDIEGSQCFPRFLYHEADQTEDNTRQGDMLAGMSGKQSGGRRDAITDAGLAHFQAAYPGETITKDDLFHYVYGLLHSEDYRNRYADNLSKELPRIPAVKNFEDFRAFVEAGRTLGDLHCDYDQAEPYPTNIAQGDLRLAHIPDPERFYRVEQMKFAGKRPNLDKSTVIYNANITLTGIPLEAYDYVVNGKPALEWVMERQCVKTDKASGILNAANRYATETVGDPAYPLKLFQRVITVSLKTMEIVRSLPPLDDLG